MTNIETQYRQQFTHSAGLHEQALARFPNGVTHDGRHAQPFPLYIERSHGAYKWDVDDNRMIDYWCGHGSLLLGHGHPAVVAAVQAQAERGTHYGASHTLELRWAALVQQMVPSAERVRFTSSGTEATMLALRLARAYTRRPTIIRFAGHFHGWSELTAPGADPYDPHVGIAPVALEQIVTLPPDLVAVEQALAERDDIAAVILEPSGAAYGIMPLPDDFLRDLRALTAERDVLLICDEVVTGFRVTPGGVQQRSGIVADITCLAKVLAGGLPGGAVVGRADVMAHLAFGNAEWNAKQKIRHQGTYNANPLSAAAGSAALAEIAASDACTVATARCQELIAVLNDVLAAHRLRGWTVYGDASIFHLFADNALDIAPGELPTAASLDAVKRGGDPQLRHGLRMALLLAGVDLMRGKSGFVSAAHSADDVAATGAALDRAVTMLRTEGMV